MIDFRQAVTENKQLAYVVESHYTFVEGNRKAPEVTEDSYVIMKIVGGESFRLDADNSMRYKGFRVLPHEISEVWLEDNLVNFKHLPVWVDKKRCVEASRVDKDSLLYEEGLVDKESIEKFLRRSANNPQSVVRVCNGYAVDTYEPFD